jgi:hypothetical protein
MPAIASHVNHVAVAVVVVVAVSADLTKQLTVRHLKMTQHQ